MVLGFWRVEFMGKQVKQVLLLLLCFLSLSCGTVKNLFNSATGNYRQMAKDRISQYESEHEKMLTLFDKMTIASDDVLNMRKLHESLMSDLKSYRSKELGKGVDSKEVSQFYSQQETELNKINAFYSDSAYAMVKGWENFCVKSGLDYKQGALKTYFEDYEAKNVANADMAGMGRYLKMLENGAEDVPKCPIRIYLWSDKYETLIDAAKLSDEKAESAIRRICSWTKGNGDSHWGGMAVIDGIVYYVGYDFWKNGKLVSTGDSFSERCKAFYKACADEEIFNEEILGFFCSYLEGLPNYLLVKIDPEGRQISCSAKVDGEFVQKPSKGKFKFSFKGPYNELYGSYGSSTMQIEADNQALNLIEAPLGKKNDVRFKQSWFMVSDAEDFVKDITYLEYENYKSGFKRISKPKCSLEVSLLGNKYELWTGYGYDELSALPDAYVSGISSFFDEYGNCESPDESVFDKWNYVLVQADQNDKDSPKNDYMLGTYPLTRLEWQRYKQTEFQKQSIKDYGFKWPSNLAPIHPKHTYDWEVGDDSEIKALIDVVEYCNMRSVDEGLDPCYEISSMGYIKFDKEANGYRVPTVKELIWAAKGGKLSKGYKYPGSDYVFEVSRKGDFVFDKVGGKKPNELGFYDMAYNNMTFCCNYDFDYALRPEGEWEIGGGTHKGQYGVGGYGDIITLSYKGFDGGVILRLARNT